MPALVAGIHAFLVVCREEGVDGRNKSGHDEATHIVTTRYSPSTLTGNVSATYGPSTSFAPLSTLTSKRRTWTRRGSHQDLPVRMSYSQECHGQRITSPWRE